MNTMVNKKVAAWSFLLIVVMVSAAVPAVRHVVYENKVVTGLDAYAETIVDESLKRATYAYALARSFNAVISVIQESHLQVEPGGVGVSIALGEALDPINDLIERFSWVMLASLVSLGIQKALIEISPWLSIACFLTLSLLFFMLGLWFGKRTRFDFFAVGRTFLFIVLMVRFCVPVMAFLNNQAYELVLKDKHNHLVGLIETDMAQIKEAESAAEKEVSFPMPDKGEPGWFEKSRNAVARTLEQGASRLDIRARLDRIIEITKGLFENLIELIVVFLLNTILLPMLFLWGVIRFGQIIVASGFMNIYKKGLLGT